MSNQLTRKVVSLSQGPKANSNGKIYSSLIASPGASFRCYFKESNHDLAAHDLCNPHTKIETNLMVQLEGIEH